MIEAGTNVSGEIKAAADIILPHVAIVTNVGACHLEEFGTVGGVMEEKGELFKGVGGGGVCIVNLDD